MYRYKHKKMFIQILINSIISACLLSLVAIGFNLIFNATKIFHLAHGAIYVCVVYVLYEFIKLFQEIFLYEVAIAVSIVLSLLFISFLILSIEYLVYLPLYRKKANSVISLISSLGVYLFIINLIIFFFGNESISLHKNINIMISNDFFKLTDIELIQIVVSITLLITIAYFSKTKFYTQIRAITDNYLIAEKFGINIKRTRVLSLIAGTILVGIAGIMKGYEIAVDPEMGLTIVLTASVAVIVGGISSLKGTVISCFIIALIDNYSVKFLMAQWKEMLIYIILIAVLILYKQGLISTKQRIETR